MCRGKWTIEKHFWGTHVEKRIIDEGDDDEKWLLRPCEVVFTCWFYFEGICVRDIIAWLLSFGCENTHYFIIHPLLFNDFDGMLEGYYLNIKIFNDFYS